MLYLKAYLATSIVFFALDYVWLTRVATSFYRGQIGPLMLEQPRLGVAALFYIFYVLGIVVFAVIPAVKADSVMTAAVLGAMLGLVAYGTYDITNYATLRSWTIPMVLVDITWGAVLTGVSAASGFLILRLI